MEKIKSGASFVLAASGLGASLQDAKDVAQLILVIIMIASAALTLLWAIQDRRAKLRNKGDE